MKSDIMDIIEDNELLTMDGYDDCIVGIGYRSGNQSTYVVYDTQKIINKLMKDYPTMLHGQIYLNLNTTP